MNAEQAEEIEMMSSRIVAKSKALKPLRQDRINSGIHSNQEPASGIVESSLAKRFVCSGSRSTRISGEHDSLSRRLVVRLLFSSLLFLLCALPTGLLAQTAVVNPVVTSFGSGLKNPQGVAVDAAGNVYIADPGNYRVVKVPADGGPQTTVFSYQPNNVHQTIREVTVDSAGNLYIPLTLDGYIVKIPADGGPQTTLSTGLIEPSSVAVDGAGDIFIADIGSNQVVEMPAGGGPQTVIAQGLNAPASVAVDGAGDVFIANWGDSNVLEVPAGGGAPTALGTGWTCPAGIAVDRLGNVFVSDPCKFGVVELPVGGGAQTTVGGWASNSIWQVAVDGEGDVFIAGYNNDNPPETLVVEVQTNSANLGSANVCPAGQATPAPCSQTLTLTYTVTSPSELKVGAALTQGAANPDFTVAAGGTCGVVTTGTSCTVNVTFTPTQPGPREGAIQIVDGSGNVLATTYLHGTGTGPQIAFASASQTTVGSGLEFPTAVAMDGAGDLFIADSLNQRVVELPAGGGAQIATASGGFPSGLAVDGAGDLFIAIATGAEVLESSRNGIQTSLTGFTQPQGIAADGVGDLFIADTGNNRVVEVSPGGSAKIAVGTGLLGPQGVAVDPAGNVFIADTGNNRVVEVSVLGGGPTTIGTGLTGPAGVAVDAAGDVFIADTGNNRVVEVPAGGGAQVQLGSGLYEPYGVFVAGNGDVYIADTYNNRVVKLPRSQPPALTFAATEFATTSTDSPQTVALQNVGNRPLNISDVSYPIDFPVDFFENGSEDLCIGLASLTSGQTCDLPVNFTPLHSGLLNESLIITDNSLNATAAQQVVPLSGTGVAQTSAATLTSPVAGSTLGSSNVKFTWTTGTGATEYQLWLGLSGRGSSSLYASGWLATTSTTVLALPSKGATVYARLYSLINGVSQYNDYIYTEAAGGTPAAMLTPAQGSTLGASNVKFTWSASTGATEYQLWLGLSGPGSSSLYASGWLTATSTNVPSLPAKGATVYARLYSLIDGAAQYNDYTYTEATAGTPAAMLTPTQGSTLATSGVQFTWTAGTGSTEYQLWLGLSGPGSSSLYASGWLAATSTTVPNLPAKGSKVYARLYSLINGAAQYNDYTYTEQ